MTGSLLRLMPAERVETIRRRSVDRAVLEGTAVILDDIEARGDRAVIEYAVRFGDATAESTFVHGPESFCHALAQVSESDRGVLERTASRIRAFADAQRSCLSDLSVPIEGGTAGHSCVPVRSVGCYAPGGRYPLPSSVLMTVIAARAAGVEEVWVASPRPTNATLAAAAIAGADRLLAIGGAQAIGALAFGRCGAPACDMIAGPGNRWVTAAKQLVSDRVGIDMLAGPSELVVLCDDSANPDIVAADLLSQAEHDDDAVPILISTSPSVLVGTEASLRRLLTSLPSRATALRSLENGYAVVADDTAAAIRLCDRIAPEHLQIMTRDSAEVAQRVRNAGSIFIGHASAEVFGDYGAGPNHVLPTGGTARFKAGLSVFTFLRPRTWVCLDGRTSSVGVVSDAAALARMEGLEAHARAAEARR